jgi:3-methyladenine DNA glycosylase AlkD
VVKAVKGGISLAEVEKLLDNRWHEVRLCGFLLLVSMFEKLATKRLTNDAEATKKRDEIVDFYLQHAHQANNWDLVDLSAPKLLGAWLMLPTTYGAEGDAKKRQVMDSLAFSDAQSMGLTALWLQRIGMVSTWKTTQQGDPSWCLRYAEVHVRHPHDLMQKAVGWMLREVGKRVSIDLLRDFLRQHSDEMPRTMLRYAIELMSADERRQWLGKEEEA